MHRLKPSEKRVHGRAKHESGQRGALVRQG
jgi:hypothetical protein